MQVQLADMPGALSGLLALRLQHDDEDSRCIADGIVAALVSPALPCSFCPAPFCPVLPYLPLVSYILPFCSALWMMHA